MLRLSSRVIARPEMISVEVDDEIVMLNVESGQYFNLDPIGTRIWKTLAGSIEVEALCRTLAEEFDAPQKVIEADVLALMTELAANNLITVDA